MHTRSLVLVAATAAAASAQHHPVQNGHQAHKRALYGHVQARQTDIDTSDFGSALTAAASEATGCLGPLLTAYESLPTPPADLLSYEMANPATDFCNYKFPDSLTAEFSSYETAVSSWFSTQSSAIDSALSQCPDYSSLASEVVGVCSTVVGGGSGSGSGSAATTTDASGAVNTGSAATGSGFTSVVSSAPTGSGTSSSGSSSTVSQNAGPRETGILAGAIAAAGFLGMVAAL